MDETGFRAHLRADRQDRQARLHATRYEDPRPLDEVDDEDVRNQINVPKPVPQLTGYEVHGYRPPPAVAAGDVPGSLQEGTMGLQGSYGDPAPPAGSEAAKKHYRMKPHIQLQCGPMLRYDTCIDGIYHAFALIVVADEGSDYSCTPNLQYRYTPKHSLEGQFNGMLVNGKANGTSNGHSSQEVVQKVDGQNIWIYHSLTGPNSFWRFKMEIKQGELEMPVQYCVNGGREITFYVPGREQNFRWVGHSCNGFSAGVDTEAFNGPDPLWNDVLKQHSKQPIHVLVGGGDQIYCDALAREPEMLEWMGEKDNAKKIAAILTPSMRTCVDRFFFAHYVKWFRNGAFGRAIAQVPQINMLDDHDLIDGFGSYPDDVQSCPVFSHIGSRGIYFYQLFQNFIVDEYDGTHPAGTDLHVSHPMKSMIIGGPGPWVPFDNHSFLTWLGPKVRMLLLDCRTERKINQIVSPHTYERVFTAMRALPPSVSHLILLLGVPIAYPRMVFAETILASKFNPMVALAKSGLMLSNSLNKFNGDAELLDDLNDHWTAKTHKEERNWLILELQKLAVSNCLRVSILSGDVHLAAVGRLFDYRGVEPAKDPKYMLNIVSSAIVNTPPPAAIIGLQGKLNSKKHKTLHAHNTDENMLPLFEHDTDGKKLKNPCFLGRRNYCLNQLLPATGDFEFDMRIEIAQGIGETKGYPVRIPPPGW